MGLRKEGGLDTNAALRATENLETAPPSELIARIQALLLQNEQLAAKDGESRTELDTIKKTTNSTSTYGCHQCPLFSQTQLALQSLVNCWHRRIRHQTSEIASSAVLSAQRAVDMGSAQQQQQQQAIGYSQ